MIQSAYAAYLICHLMGVIYICQVLPNNMYFILDFLKTKSSCEATYYIMKAARLPFVPRFKYVIQCGRVLAWLLASVQYYDDEANCC